MNLPQLFHNKFRDNEVQIHELNYLFWECTHRCNLNCLHCGSDCISSSRHPDMPFEDFLQAILPLKEIYPRDSILVVITGGEPLLRKDLEDCGRQLREHGFRWSIVSNGYAYHTDRHAQLLAAGMGAITLSIDGLEEQHNWLRNNPKSFSHVAQALELIAATPRLNYDVVTCVNANNVDSLPDLYHYFIEKRIAAWRLFTIAPIGRACENEKMQLSPPQTRQLMDFIVQVRKEGIVDAKFSCEAYVGSYDRKVRDAHFFCRAGINIASILIDGSISACPNINRHFAQGNIYKDSFVEVWNNKFSIMRDRSWTKVGACAHCKEYKNCKGGAFHLWNEKKEGILVCTHQKILATKQKRKHLS